MPPADFMFVAADINIVFFIIPGRYAVTPPDLAADTPVLYIVHPLVVSVLPVIRYEADRAVFDSFDRGPRQRSRLHIPLVCEERFDDGTGTIATRHHQFVFFDFFQQLAVFQVGDDLFASLVAVETNVGSGN